MIDDQQYSILMNFVLIVFLSELFEIDILGIGSNLSENHYYVRRHIFLTDWSRSMYMNEYLQFPCVNSLTKRIGDCKATIQREENILSSMINSTGEVR